MTHFHCIPIIAHLPELLIKKIRMIKKNSMHIYSGQVCPSNPPFSVQACSVSASAFAEGVAIVGPLSSSALANQGDFDEMLQYID